MPTEKGHRDQTGCFRGAQLCAWGTEDTQCWPWGRAAAAVIRCPRLAVAVHRQQAALNSARSRGKRRSQMRDSDLANSLKRSPFSYSVFQNIALTLNIFQPQRTWRMKLVFKGGISDKDRT